MIIIIMYQLCKCVQKAKHLSLANDALLSVTAHRVLVNIMTHSALVPFLIKTKSSKVEIAFSNYYDVKQV